MKPELPLADVVCLIHYHEIGLKGRNRSSFERQLQENIEKCLRGVAAGHIRRISGRLLAVLPSWDDALTVAAMIARIPGVVRVSTGLKSS
ncbi:MAG: hypothetical protein LBR39_06845, partial [Coriobacteriales bacterium]|nr:hypothetical protein [Coriobacteriales bacterium]